MTQHKTRSYVFEESGPLKIFLVNYRMTIERCLKTMAMDSNCQADCSERVIHEFGLAPKCTALCSLNAQKSLTKIERHVILYSMVYVSNSKKDERGNPIQNMHPDVRE